MSRTGAGAILLVLTFAAVADAAFAQTLHEDYSRASADYRLLRIFAGLALAQVTDGLNASLELDHENATGDLRQASARSTSMVDAASRNATAATSTEPLAPLASAAANLTRATSQLSDDWRALHELDEQGLHTMEDVARARLRQGAIGDGVHTSLQAAADFDALGYDTTWLRAGLQSFVAEVDLRIDTQPADANAPFLALEVVPARSIVTRTFEVRGVLVAPAAEGSEVRLEIDGAPLQLLISDRAGYFSLRLTSTADDIGRHVAQAHAQNLTSEEVSYEVLRYPTRISLSVASPASGLAVFQAHLQDMDGRPLADRTVHLEPGAGTGPVGVDLVTDNTGRASIVRENVTATTWNARASFAGDTFYAPSTVLVKAVVPPPPPPPPPPRADDAALPWQIIFVALALVAHPVGLEMLGRRRERALFTTLFLMGPPTILALLLVVLKASAPVAVTILAATTAIGFWVAHRHRGILLDLALAFARPTSPTPAVVGGGPAAAMAAAEPPATATSARVATRAPVSAPKLTPLEELLAIWDAMLTRLQRDGIDPRPLTVREAVAALRPRTMGEASTRPLVRLLERVLYGNGAPRADELADARAVASALEVSP